MPEKILVVDDEESTVTMTKMILENEGFQVITAYSGEESIKKAEAEKPDLILMDMMMPGISGLEACKTLKAQTSTKTIPVLMFTVLAREIDYENAREAGAKTILKKPFTHESLLKEVKSHLWMKKQPKS